MNTPSSNMATVVEPTPTSDDMDRLVDAEVVGFARQAMERATGTNCTFVDDDLKVLAILAWEAVRTGLHRDLDLPKSLLAALDKHAARGEVS